jgi:hypothetical protein
MILHGSTQLFFPLMLMLHTVPLGQSFWVLQPYSGRQPAAKSLGFPEKPSIQMQVLWWLSVTQREFGPHCTLLQASTHRYWPFTDWQISL